MKDNGKSNYSYLHRTIILLSIVWIIVVSASLAWNIFNEHRNVIYVARKEAVSNLDKDLAFRHWASRHGGIYVPPDKRTPPNPHLAHIPDRDVVTNTGKALTLMNPAYMLRQMMEEYSELYGVRGRITSFKYLNPINKPDEWETKVLKAFESGKNEVSEVANLNDKPYYRLMRPMITNENCLKCHAFQGYKVGDIRGGISVSVPLTPYYNIERRSIILMILSHFLFLCLGFAGLSVILKKGKKLITERTKIKQQHETILSTSIDGFWMVSLEGKLIQVNDAYCNMTEYTQQELLQMTINDIEDIESPEETKKRIKKIMETGGDRFETKHRCKYGEIIDVEIGVNYIKADNILFAFIRNITKRKQMESEIQLINKNLQKRVDEEVAKNRTKDQLMFEQSRHVSMGELLMNISHHWRQPLCAVGCAIQDIEDAYRHGELDEAYIANNVNNAMNELITLSETIDNFRNFYVQGEDLTEFNIADDINSAEAILEDYNISRSIIIEKELDESLTAKGYPHEFAQVILNILTNAKDKFEERKITDGIVRVKLYKDAAAGKAIISISDNGGEIQNDIINKIFEPYFTTKGMALRTGMGLYMAKVIVEQNMKGTISVRNIDGWCEFRIEI
ncbi:c-type heme family protein [Candidatus Magnetomonas plexicatena]|uniref:c-type heme family protein n=1 Tax=Candidatus Magnetomonas plexicatena TaxID=2552947 RepID=UPI001C75CB82|nr:DUF3365 domain-containing protein [Nitrospirales bacterium LBB_01]